MSPRRKRTPPTPECAQHPGFAARPCALCQAESIGEQLAQSRPEDLEQLEQQRPLQE